MDQFIKLLPDEKEVTCLEDLLSLKVSEQKKILCSYNEKVSGNKADLVLRTYAVFSRAKEGSSAALSRCTGSSICKYHEMYSLKCGHLPWVSNLRGTPPFTFVQLYNHLVLRTSRYKHIFLKQTGYKKIKSFKFFYEGFIRKFLVTKDGDHTFFGVRMKASMKNTLYKVLIVLDSSDNVSNAACTCPAGSGLGDFGNCNHVGGVLLYWKILIKKAFINLRNQYHAHQSYLLGMFLHLLLHLCPLMKLLYRTSNLVQIILGVISRDTTHLLHVCQVIEY